MNGYSGVLFGYFLNMGAVIDLRSKALESILFPGIIQEIMVARRRYPGSLISP